MDRTGSDGREESKTMKERIFFRDGNTSSHIEWATLVLEGSGGGRGEERKEEGGALEGMARGRALTMPATNGANVRTMGTKRASTMVFPPYFS
jgi:hypothetical protein